MHRAKSLLFIIIIISFGKFIIINAENKSKILKIQYQVDCVDIGNANSVINHDLFIKGTGNYEMINVEIGSLRPTYPVVTLSRYGSTLSAKMRVNLPRDGVKQILLEVQEIHNRRPQTLAYTIQVNGKDIYFRTYDEMSAGPNHYFVQVPVSLANKGFLSIVFRNESNAPFSVAKVWAYGDFNALAHAEVTYQPMAVAEDATWLLNDFVTKGADVTPKRSKFDKETDIKAWDVLKKRMSGTGFAPSIFTNISYGNMTFSDVKKLIDKDLWRAVNSNIDMNIAFNASEWGYHPNGQDGLGGYFSDIKYSKVLYNVKKNDYRATWLNTPGNTTWPTWNNSQLNKYLAHRLTKAVQYFCDRRDFLLARGYNVPNPVMNQEWGLSVMDHNDATLSLAKKEGVELTPESDSLSVEQKKWIFSNLCKTTSRFGEVFDKATGKNRIIIRQGKVFLPDNQTKDDNYFQTFADPIEPYYDDKWAGWQFGVSQSAWASGEFLPQLPSAYYDYIIALGKLTAPNMERLGLPKLDYYQTLYQRGCRQVTPINAHAGDLDEFLPQALGMDNKPADAPVHCDRKLLEFRYLSKGGLGPTDILIEARNVKNTTDPGTYDCLKLVNAESPGVITYKITNEYPDSNRPILVNLVCKLPEDKQGKISFAVGENLNGLKIVSTLTTKNVSPVENYHWRSTGTANLGTSVSNLKTFYLQIRIIGNSIDDAIIERFRIVQAWGKQSGNLYSNTGFDMKQMRTLNLWIQDRAVFERTLADYQKQSGEDKIYKLASNLAKLGQYKSAYKILSGAISNALPVGFAVSNYGKLANYPIEVKVFDEKEVVLVDLIKLDSNAFEFNLKSEKKVDCQIIFKMLKNGATFTVEKKYGNHYCVYPAKEKIIDNKVTNGQLTVNCTVIPEDEYRIKLPKKLSGVYLSSNSEGIFIETQQDELWLDNPIFVLTVKNTNYQRKPAGGSDEVRMAKPTQRDQVDILIDSTGVATHVNATFGVIQDKIKAFYPPKATGETSNGAIELENGNRFEISNMWWNTDLIALPPLKSFVRANSNEALINAFTPGKEVKIEFCPYTYNGRLPRINKISEVK